MHASESSDIAPHSALQTNAKIILVVVFAAMPFALWALVSTSALPFIVSIGALGTAFASWILARRGDNSKALNIQISGLAILGTTMAVTDPALADFGMATALLAPVLASLLGKRENERLAWTLTVLAIGVATLSSQMNFSWFIANNNAANWTAGLAYLVAAIIVSRSAHGVSEKVEKFRAAHLNTFRHLVEHLQNGVLRYSAAGEAVFVSESSETLFGCPRYELAGSGFVERMHVQDRPRYLTALSDAGRGEHSRMAEVRMRRDVETSNTHAANAHAAPNFFWVEISFSPVMDMADQHGRFEVIALLRDISRRKAQEEEMREARQMAEKASNAKSHFLATVGHELRTPLNAIVGFSEMMTSEIVGKLEGSQREYAELIHKSGMHLLDIVNMLLDMSRIEAGKFELQLEEFVPDELVQPCVNIVEQLAKDQNVHVVSDISGHLPRLTGDERAYRQIVINLLSNAIKFSQAGGEVKFSMRRQGQYLNLSVTDTGIGMSKEVVERLGEPFFQAQHGIARQYEGTGLGLSIVKGLIELHDGKLHVTSAPDKGTMMTCLMPIKGPRIVEDTTPVVTKLHTKTEQQTPSQWQETKSIAL